MTVNDLNAEVTILYLCSPFIDASTSAMLLISTHFGLLEYSHDTSHHKKAIAQAMLNLSNSRCNVSFLYFHHGAEGVCECFT
jgi:hypothetical protein